MTKALHQVLVVDDEPDIRRVLRVLLESANYRVVEAATAERGEVEARTHKPDAMILDLGLPDADGVSVVKAVRRWSTLPILVLSARTMEAQKIAALDAGADDYVTKPFSAPELLARVRAALRRNARVGEQPPTLRIGELVVDLARREAHSSAGEPVHFTPLEWRVLESLARNAGLIVTQTQLIREAWGPDRLDDTRNLRVSIKNLRQKLEPNPAQPRFLITEIGVGYRLIVAPPTEAEGR
jgi:two-component system, OmpR family, KDP operon response regulator KdpE